MGKSWWGTTGRGCDVRPSSGSFKKSSQLEENQAKHVETRRGSEQWMKIIRLRTGCRTPACYPALQVKLQFTISFSHHLSGNHGDSCLFVSGVKKWVNTSESILKAHMMNRCQNLLVVQGLLNYFCLCWATSLVHIYIHPSIHASIIQ